MPSTADIPAVERQITTAERLLTSHWDQTATAAVDVAVEELELAMIGQDKPLTTSQKAAIVAAVLLLMSQRFDTPMSGQQKNRARRMSNDLVLAGIQSTSGFGRLNRSGRTMQRLSRRGGAELEALGRWRARSDAFEARVAASVEDFVEREEARRTTSQREAEEAEARAKALREISREIERRADGTQPPPAEPKLSQPPLRSDGRVAAEDKSAWLADFRRTMEIAANSSGPIADAWAYRQYNIGRFIAMRAAGVKVFEAFNNPPDGPDDRTTNFCRWVHLKPIKVERIERQLNVLAQAVREDDRALIETAWPLLSLSGSPSISDFRLMFLGVALPPYHWRCRTVVQEGKR